MSNMARRTYVKVSLDGVDISPVINKYLLSVSFSEYEEDKADDIQIKLQDRDGTWLINWLEIAVGGKSSITGMPMAVSFIRANWNGYGDSMLLDCGIFELDSVSAVGPPCTITFKGTALPFTSSIRMKKKNNAWEHYTLKKIAEEIAKKNGMKCFFDCDENPYYDRVDQVDQTDIVFLKSLCRKSGISLKATTEKLVLFDQVKYEGKEPIAPIKYGSGYISYSFQTSEADKKYTSCQVKYTDPETKKTYKATFVDPNLEGKDDARLEIRERVTSDAEALTLAKKMLRLKNKFQTTARFTYPGTPYFLAGVNVMLSGFGAFNGKYMISGSKHQIGDSGYRTDINLRPVLEGY